MSIKKQLLKNKPIVKVTFEITKEQANNAQSISLLSEHNDWQEIEFKKFKNGKFKVAENISTIDRQGFQFIYKVISEDGSESTLLPEDADSYTDNGMNDGGKNAVLIIA
ncbi:hypothetical protein E2R68_12780 [Psychromonas sp. RZ22]|uniref:hypothetical protein n=1 Tax=Psychromonas algarum TaxID=2555643 RepID=UPI00106761B5|nr:hypothetical protein [Psychromonas sp. RZ22]TEW53356.1 hypothetical protein E2R68_12780 [Psychromonas sp. RZ22]